MQAKGYGELKPIDTNISEEGRAVNRRVEFTLLKK
jgi:flagellar motor protein MotB